MRVSTRSEDYADLIRCLSTWHLTSCHSGSSHSSELELEGELDGTGAADLIEGVEAAISAAGAQAATGRAQVWMVENVEKLRAETQTQLLGQMKLPLQPHIRLRCPEPA